MHKRITFRTIDKSDHIEQYANQQLEKIVKFLEHENTPRYIDLVIDAGTQHPREFRIELRVKTPNYDKITSYQGYKFNDVLDRVIDVMYNQLTEEKRKHVDQRKKSPKI